MEREEPQEGSILWANLLVTKAVRLQPSDYIHSCLKVFFCSSISRRNGDRKKQESKVKRGRKEALAATETFVWWFLFRFQTSWDHFVNVWEFFLSQKEKQNEPTAVKSLSTSSSFICFVDYSNENGNLLRKWPLLIMARLFTLAYSKNLVEPTTAVVLF